MNQASTASTAALLLAAKKVALALHSLIKSQFPRDKAQLPGDVTVYAPAVDRSN